MEEARRQRRRELRIAAPCEVDAVALGARLGQVMGMFVGYGAKLAAVGIVFGLGAALLLARVMSSMLFEVSPVDPVTFSAVSVALLGIAALASCIPALRALSIDPAEALRAE